jgi:hypothetical protein
LNEKTVALIDKADAVCVFVNDTANAAVCDQLAKKELRSSRFAVPVLIILILPLPKAMGCAFAVFLLIHQKPWQNMHWRSS